MLNSILSSTTAFIVINRQLVVIRFTLTLIKGYRHTLIFFAESHRMIMVQPTATMPSQSNGIDIRDALSILSSRAKSGGDSSEIKSSSDVPSELRNMGQQIDIVNEMEFAKPNALGCDCIRPDTNGDGDIPAAAAAALSEEEAKKHTAMKAEREKRTKEIQNKLSSMNVGDLLGMIFTAQGERVATYKLFDE